MKRIIAVFIGLVTSVFALAPTPLVFDKVAADSATQQHYWDELLKYKLWGRDYLQFSGSNIQVTEAAGYTGTLGDLTMYNNNHTINGHLVVGGNIVTQDGSDYFDQGYVRVGGGILVGSNGHGSTFFKQPTCEHTWDGNEYGQYTKDRDRGDDQCPVGFPALETDLDIPVYSGSYGTNYVEQNGSHAVINGIPTSGTVRDIYLDHISLTNGAKLLVQQATTGGITRIFVKNLNLDGTDWAIGVTYDGTTMVDNANYRGSLLIYTPNGFTVAAGNKRRMQGSYISAGLIEVKQSLYFAGQLIGAQLKVDNGFNATDFQYVPFDPPVLDPTALASGVFYESIAGNQTVNIRLDRDAVIDVTFKVWITTPGGVDTAEAADLIASTYPATYATAQSIVIPKGSRVPVTPLVLQVNDDLLMENTETFFINIADLEGAVLPGNTSSGSLPLSIVDNDQLQPPVLGDTTVALPENSLLGTSVVVLTATDLNNTDKLNYTIISGDDSGVFAIDSATNKGYITVAKPSALDFEGTPKSWTLVVRVTDNTGRSDDATVIINLTNVNETPSEPALSANTIAENSVVGTNIGTFSATDPDAGAVLTYTLVSGTGSDDNASFSLVGNQLKSAAVFNYEVKSTYTIRVRVSDGSFHVEKAFTILVTDVDEKPVVSNSSYSTDEDVALTVAAADGVLKNASDPEGKAIIASLVTAPAHGTLVLNTNGSFVYTPAANFNGTDSFVFTVADQWNTSAPATAVIVVKPVNDAPVAVNQTYNTDEDLPLVIAAAAGVLKSATDVEGDPLSAVLVAGPAHGTLTLNADGSFTYSPAANYNGSDAFTFRAQDDKGLQSSIMTATITVKAVNDAPLAVNQTYTTAEDVTLTVTVANGLRKGSSDVEGDVLAAVKVTNPSHGTLTLATDGSFSYVPAANFNGTDSFTFQLKDPSNALSPVYTATIVITPVNDAPVAVDMAYQTDEDVALTIAKASGVLSLATDVDGDALTTVLVDDVAHGTLVLSADGSFIYTPVATWSGTDAFTYRVVDPSSATSVVKTATITVKYVNDAPVALEKSYQVIEDKVLTVLAADGVLVGVTDEENHAVTAQVSTATAYGALSLAPNGAFEYTPKHNFFGRDEFFYVVVDEFGAKSAPSRVVIQVLPGNDPPIFADVSFSVPENTPAGSLIGTLTAQDPDGDPISYSLVSGTGFSIDKSGNITVADGMVLDYEATKTYSLVVAVSDGTDAVNGNVTITVTDLPERTDVVVVSATNTDSTWKYPDTVWVNKTILAVEWAVDGVLRNDTDNVASNAKTLLVKTATSPSKDLPGSDTLVVFMSDKTPEVELELPPDRPEPVEGVTVVEPSNPNDTVIYINNSEKDIVVEIKTVDERLQPIVKYDTIHPPLKEGLNEVTYTYTDIYGNTTTTTVYVYLDLTPPVVEITSPADRFVTDNVVQAVAWKVDGVYMNVLNVQTLTKGVNWIIRTYRDKAGNEGSDTVMVYFDMGKDIDLSLEKPLITMDEKTIEKYYATNPPAKDELYSLSILNVKTGLEEKTQYGKGGSVHEADGSEPYPGLSGSHLGPTVQIHIRLPQMGGTNAMGDQRSGLVSDLVDSTGMVLVTSGATPERVSWEEYVKNHCLDGVFGNMTKEEILASPLFESTVGLGVHIYDVSGQFVDRMSIVQKINKAAYLDDAGMLTLFFELKPSRNHGLVDVTGRQYGTGAYILDADVNSISKRLCDMPDGKKGELVKSSAASLEKFGYVRDSYTD